MRNVMRRYAEESNKPNVFTLRERYKESVRKYGHTIKPQKSRSFRSTMIKDSKKQKKASSRRYHSSRMPRLRL